MIGLLKCPRAILPAVIFQPPGHHFISALGRRLIPRYSYTRLLSWVVTLLLSSVIFPSPALAIVPHWDPREAFLIRQFSYLFFMFAIIIFLYELKQGQLHYRRGFRLLVWASVLFALWSVDCFLGQLFALYSGAQVIAGTAGSWSARLEMANLGNWLSYFTKLDHLLLVPAFMFLYLGLRALRREQEAGEL
jgi:peptidoglycan biosynthesis protein MviN/MurJ (putative lipid II flippase)